MQKKKLNKINPKTKINIFNLKLNKTIFEKIIKFSRDIHFLNDDRSKIKLEINTYTGSKIKEIKEYTNY